MTTLAIETSCDETAVAILRRRNSQSGAELLASEVASQIAEHAKFGGVVPEVASRNHLAQLPRLLQRAMASAKIRIDEIDAFAATSGPGLASSLLVGNSAAKGLAIGAGKPFLAINHLEGHVLSPFFGRENGATAEEKNQHARRMSARTGETPVFRPHVALIVSGGHTLLVHVRGVGDYEILGRTLDDAAGEAFDKVAKLLRLGYPGGPEIEQRARGGDPTRFDLPRSMLDSGDLNFSFSGLKTAVRYLLPKLEGDFLNDLCASFQAAVVDVLVKKTLSAAHQAQISTLTISGGVSCNQALRTHLSTACEKVGLRFLAAAPELCTDNAAMIAFAASLRVKLSLRSSVTDEIDPNLALGSACGSTNSTV